jgi:deltex-like protein
MASWCWRDGATWALYDAASASQLEGAFRNLSVQDVPLGGGSYIVDLQHMVQTNTRTGFTRKVRRETAGAVASWSWLDGSAHSGSQRWTRFDAAASDLLTACATLGRAHTSLHLQTPNGLWTYEVDLVRGVQTNVMTRNERPLRCDDPAVPSLAAPSAAAAVPYGQQQQGYPPPPQPRAISAAAASSAMAVPAAGSCPVPPWHMTVNAAAARPDASQLPALTGWTVLPPGGWEAGATDPVMMTDLGEDGEQVVRLPCHTQAVSCTFNVSTLEQSFASGEKCPTCGTRYEMGGGPQPTGTMSTDRAPRHDCAGHPGVGSIVIRYSFPDGTQGQHHPEPGQPYRGTSRVCYLPADEVGMRCLRMLHAAFEQRLLFRVGSSATTGKSNTVVWHMHQKTRRDGGETVHGWPDPKYVERLQSECAAANVKGVLDF